MCQVDNCTCSGPGGLTGGSFLDNLCSCLCFPIPILRSWLHTPSSSWLPSDPQFLRNLLMDVGSLVVILHLLWTWPSSAPHQFPRFLGGPKPLYGHPALPEVKSNRDKRTGPFLCTIQPDGQAVDQSSRTVFLIPNWNGAHVRIQKGVHTSNWYPKWHRRWQISFLQHLEVEITFNYGNQLISVLQMSHKHWFYS